MAPVIATAQTAQSVVTEQDVHESVRRIITYLGDDPDREGLRDTPDRYARALDEMFNGYCQDPTDILSRSFQSDGYDEMILLSDIEFYSTCEHHLQPFFGKAHVAYIPKGRVVGISKLARLIEIFARRLQIQERLTRQIADTLMRVAHPKGVGVVLEAKHFCMVCRGVEKQNSILRTSALTGIFRQASVRAEFFSMIHPQ